MDAIQNYLRLAQNEANENFNSADGFFDDDLQFTGREDFFGAAGDQVATAAMAPTSQPYILTVTNTGAAFSNLDILGSFLYISNSTYGTWTAGSYVVTNGGGTITIASGIPNVTYQEMLYQFQANPFSVGLTYIQSTTAGQVLKTLSVTTQDANGNLASKPFIPTIDPYQNQSDIVAMKQGYRIDGFTKITIAQVLASATIQFNIYPSNNINLARGLAARPVSSNFASPQVIKSQPIAIRSIQ